MIDLKVPEKSCDEIDDEVISYYSKIGSEI